MAHADSICARGTHRKHLRTWQVHEGRGVEGQDGEDDVIVQLRLGGRSKHSLEDLWSEREAAEAAEASETVKREGRLVLPPKWLSQAMGER